MIMLWNYYFMKDANYVFSGEFQCPVLNKVFTEFTHIVAVRTTGNVFCYEVYMSSLDYKCSNTCLLKFARCNVYK